jgi:putative transposase
MRKVCGRTTERKIRTWDPAARFLFVHAAVYNAFNFQRHLVSRSTLRRFRAEAMNAGNEVTVAA